MIEEFACQARVAVATASSFAGSVAEDWASGPSEVVENDFAAAAVVVVAN